MPEEELRRQYRRLIAQEVLRPLDKGGVSEDDYVALCESEDGPLAPTKRAIDRNAVVAVFFQREIQAVFCDRAEVGRILVLELDGLAAADAATIWNYLRDEKTKL